MLPLDRLRQAGATDDELAALESLSEAEQLSIENELQGQAESGVREFVERYRRVFEASAEEPAPEEQASSGTITTGPRGKRPAPDADSDD